MRAAFADTSFWIALLNERDQHHQLALILYQSLDSDLYTSDWVLTEFANHSRAPQSRQPCALFIKRLKAGAGCVVIPSTDSLFKSSLALYENRPDKHWSLTDCASFVIMEELEIKQALTADHHFEQAGFEILLK